MVDLDPTTLGVIPTLDRYKDNHFTYNMYPFIPTYNIEWNLYTREIVSIYMLKYTMNANKIQGIVNRLERLLRNEKVANNSKQLQIIELEKKVVEMGIIPLDATLRHNLLKEKKRFKLSIIS